MFGYHGRYLRIDVDGRRGPSSFAAGRGRCCAASSAASAWRPGSCTARRPPGVDPLAPAAPLVFAFSPLVGTPLTTSAKFAVVASRR